MKRTNENGVEIMPSTGESMADAERRRQEQKPVNPII